MPAVDAIKLYTAGEAISAGRAVIVNGGLLYHFQPTNPAHVNRVAGISMSAAASSGIVEVQVFGVFESVVLSLTPDNPVFVTTNGALSIVPPVSGTAQYIGTAIATDRILINRRESIKR